MKLNGCHNRAPLKAHRGRDGYWCDGVALTIKSVTIPQTMAKDCQYTHSKLGQVDKGCEGCKHKTTPHLGATSSASGRG